MLAEDAFVAARRADWDELEVILSAERRLEELPGRQISRVAALYRSVCADLMRARAAGYGMELLRFLDGLAARAHNTIYAAPPYRLAAVWDLVARDFPRALRARLPLLALAAGLFLIPGVVGFAGALGSARFASQVLPQETLAQMEQAYSEGFSQGRDAGQDALMAGFYVYNNIGIAFRCFGTGIFFGVGSFFFLLYNGLVIGTVFGHVFRLGHGANLLTFTCGHSPFELLAIVIAGAAGLQLGHALLATGGRSRLGSLRAQVRPVASLVLGAALMLGIAAAIEGFWSPSSAPAPVKWIVASVLTGLVTLYFARAGRSR